MTAGQVAIFSVITAVVAWSVVLAHWLQARARRRAEAERRLARHTCAIHPDPILRREVGRP